MKLASALANVPAVLQWRPEHLTDQPEVWTRSEELPGISVTVMSKSDGDIRLTPVEDNMLVLSVEGCRRHFAAFDALQDTAPVRPRQVASIPKGTHVAAHWQNHGPLQTFQIIEFSNDIFAAYMPEVANDAFARGQLVCRGFSDLPVIANLIGLLARENDQTQRRGRLYAETVARLLTIEIATELWTLPPAETAEPALGDRRVQRAIDFIEAHFTTDLSIRDIATAAGISPSQLTTAFQRALGQSPYAYVISRRLERATELLRQSDLSIAHVALEAGFCDQAHLTRLCRARLGKTPRQIRQR